MRLAITALVLILVACQTKDVRDQRSASLSPGQIGEVAAVLAVVPGQGRIHNGFTRGSGENADSLKRRALTLCASDKCKVVQQWHRGECVGLVRGYQQIFWTTAQTLQDSLNQVMAKCLAADAECELLQNTCF